MNSLRKMMINFDMNIMIDYLFIFKLINNLYKLNKIIS
jgi:hypothetical protein